MSNSFDIEESNVSCSKSKRRCRPSAACCALEKLTLRTSSTAQYRSLASTSIWARWASR